VLTAASRTSQLRAIGAVSEHFRTAYDILVRPAGPGPRWRTGPAPSSPTSCLASTAASRWPPTTGSPPWPASR
jgi:hypothetical protein